MDLDKVIYVAGQLVSEKEAGISLYDHGFLYGNSLFETMRCYQGIVFRLEDHLDRLRQGAAVLGWPVIPDRLELQKAVYSALAANKLAEASVRLTVSCGQGPLKPDITACGKPVIVVFANPLQIMPEAVYNQGWQLWTATVRRNQFSPLCRIKSANYLENVLAKMEARQKGAEEALILNTAGFVAEGAVSNVFAINDGIIITPDLQSGLLPGITRMVVLEFAARFGFRLAERAVTVQELYLAEEVFITNSLIELMPVSSIDGVLVGGTVSNKLTNLLRLRYKETIADYIDQQSASPEEGDN